METRVLETDNKKNALFSGIALGAVMFVLGIIVYYIIIASASIWVISFVPLVISVILPIFIVIALGLDLRKKAGGYWTFKQATTAMFIMFIIAYGVSTIARDYIFVKLVEPDMVQKTEMAVVNATTNMMEKSGTEQATIDSKIEDMHKKFAEQKNVSVGKTIMGIGTTIVLLFVVALIFAAFLKKEQPLFDAVDPENTTE